MSTPPESPFHAGDSWRWWESRRLRYNIGLGIAGALAWALFAIEASLLTDWFSLSLAATLAQGLAWLVIMGVANLAFFLGAALMQWPAGSGNSSTATGAR